MHNYAYSAVDSLGKSIKGKMTAANDIDLELWLKQLGLDLVTVRPAARVLICRAVSSRELALLCFEMSQLIKAGVPILQALSELRDSAYKPGMREILQQLYSAVETGQPLSQAMTAYPQVFQSVFVSLIQMGENTGRLGEIFDRLAETLSWQDQMLGQTKRALAYPVFILLVVMASAAFLLGYLVPQMAAFLKNLGQELPWQTQAMMALAAWLQRWWWLCLLTTTTSFGSAIVGVRSIPAVRLYYDALKLHLPLTGEILQKAVMARFTRYLALMYHAGIPVLEALLNCRGIVGNEAVAERLDLAHQRISGGERMSECFNSLELFPPLVVSMIRIGENTGALDDALLKVCEFYERDVRNSIESLLKLLEPALTILLGSLLAVVMFSVLGPVYDAMTGMRF